MSVQPCKKLRGERGGEKGKTERTRKKKKKREKRRGASPHLSTSWALRTFIRARYLEQSIRSARMEFLSGAIPPRPYCACPLCSVGVCGQLHTIYFFVLCASLWVGKGVADQARIVG